MSDHDHTPLVTAAQSQPTQESATSHDPTSHAPDPSPSPPPPPEEKNSSGSVVLDVPQPPQQGSSFAEHIQPTPTAESRPRFQTNPYSDFDHGPMPPSRTRSRGHSRRHHTQNSATGLPLGAQSNSGLDWIVPLNMHNGHPARLTIGQRLEPTIEQAVKAKDKFARKAVWTGYALNIAIGLQVLLGALTTAMAAAVTSTKQAQESTAILGGLSTLVASYLARVRGSGEPELSVMRVKDLEQFLRECKAFQMDHAHEYGTHHNGLNERLDHFRHRFEELLGNASGQRKLSPVGVAPGTALSPAPGIAPGPPGLSFAEQGKA